MPGNPVHRLGHSDMCMTIYQKAHEVYTTFFNFEASDVVSLWVDAFFY